MSQQPPKQEVVWMRCRARPDQQIDSHRGCQGNQAVVVFRKPRSVQQGGGTVTRYRCLTCKGVWHLTI